MFGQEVQLSTDLMIGQQPPLDVTHQEYMYIEQLRNRFIVAFNCVWDRMGWVQKRQEQLYDHSVTGGGFEVEDLVWLHSPAVPQGKSPKFHRPWIAPYKVIKVLSEVTYRFQSVLDPKS